MQAVKNPKYDLKLKHRKFTEIGLIISLSIIIIAFYTVRNEMEFKLDIEVGEMLIEVEEIPVTEQIKRASAPPRSAVPIPTASEDVPMDETIEFTEIDFTELPPPPPPPAVEGVEPEEYEFIPYDEPPEIIGGLAALLALIEYPEIARKAGIEGVVYVNVLIDEKGNSAKTKVLKATVEGVGFEEAATEAIKKLRWKPAYQRDIAVKVWYSIPVRFKLREPEKSIS